MTDRVQVMKYFTPFPKGAVWMIIIGIPLLLAYGLGIVLIVIGIARLVIWNKKPTDDQMDALLEADIKKMEVLALSKTGTDESELVGKTVVVTGPRFWDIGGARVHYKMGKDKKYRFTPVEVNVINFTADQLIVYSCALDLTDCTPLNETTDEYFYRDVVSVSTKTMSRVVKMKGEGEIKLNSAETFVLTTSGGTSIEVLLRDPELLKVMGGEGTIPTNRADQAIQAVRKMLREKKGTPTLA